MEMQSEQRDDLALLKQPADENSPDLDAVHVPTGFILQDDASVNWLIRKIVEARNYAERAKAWAAAEIRRTEQDESFLLTRFGAQLEAWLRSRLALEGNRRRSLKLPAGTVGLRASSPQVTVVHEGAVLSWCRQHAIEALKLKVEVVGADATRLREWVQVQCAKANCLETIAKSVLNGYVRDNGELPPGVEMVEGGDVLYVK